MDFKLTSEFKPTGDQPEAIKQLVEGLQRGDTAQTLLGVTGSGKTFTIANVLAEINRPALVLSHNKHWLHSYTVSSNSSFRRMQSNILFLIMITTNRKHSFLLPTHILKRTCP